MDSTELKKLAYLARLEVSDKEIVGLSTDLSEILGFVKQHAQINLDGVEPLAHPLDIFQRLRPDVANQSDSRERFQQLAPQGQDGFYLVPKVID